MAEAEIDKKVQQYLVKSDIESLVKRLQKAATEKCIYLTLILETELLAVLRVARICEVVSEQEHDKYFAIAQELRERSF